MACGSFFMCFFPRFDIFLLSSFRMHKSVAPLLTGAASPCLVVSLHDRQAFPGRFICRRIPDSWNIVLDDVCTAELRFSRKA